MASLIEDVLAAWRDGERLLDSLPPLDPDRESVSRSVADLRRLYAEMTGASAVTQRKLDVSRTAVEQSRAMIESVKRRGAR